MSMQILRKPRRLVGIAFFGLAFIVSVAHGADREVDVKGCVVDYGGKRYRGVDVELKGVNYRGGAGYSGNNSEMSTDYNGEFSVKMKPGEPPPGQPTLAQVRIEIKRPYVIHGWFGQASDVAQVINLSNTGRPLDLRQQGCARYPYPISVGGIITSEELDERADNDVMVLLRAGGTETRFPVGMPWRRGGTITPAPFNFLISLSEGDPFVASIPEQPKGANCTLTLGGGRAGQQPTEEIAQNYWVTTPIRIHCERRNVEPEEPRPRLTGDKPLLTVGGVESSTEELAAFHKTWDAMEQSLYEVGEKMPDWDAFNLQNVAGRAAYFRLCGERLLLAQKRKKDETDRAKQEGEAGKDKATSNSGDQPLRRGSNSATTLFQNAIDQAEQDERDRPARQARERAAKLRTAEQERLAPPQAGADARALQEQARQSEREARELAKALADLANAIAQSRNAKQAPAPSGPGGSSGQGGCGGIGSTTCR